jgi:hypothetical protein
VRFANLIAATALAVAASPSFAQRTGIVAGDAGAAGPGTALAVDTAVTTGDQVYAIYTEALAVALKAAPRGTGVE